MEGNILFIYLDKTQRFLLAEYLVNVEGFDLVP